MGLGTDIYGTSDFFKVSVDEDSGENNPRILGVIVSTKTQFGIFCIFFFLNAFLSVWNHTLIVTLFSFLVNDSDEEIKTSLEKDYPDHLFLIYGVWTSVRNFFNLLGIVSNIIFFICTVSGAFLASVIARQKVLGVKDISLLKDHIKKDFTDSNTEFGSVSLQELKPFLK